MSSKSIKTQNVSVKLIRGISKVRPHMHNYRKIVLSKEPIFNTSLNWCKKVQCDIKFQEGMARFCTKGVSLVQRFSRYATPLKQSQNKMALHAVTEHI